MQNLIRQISIESTTKQKFIKRIMENFKTIKLTKEEIESLASGLGSSLRNYKLKEKITRSKCYDRKLDDTTVYLESKNFKIEKLKRNGEFNG